MEPVSEPARSGRVEPRRLVAAGLAALAVVLTLVGCFFPLFSTEHRLTFDSSEPVVLVFVQGAWDMTVDQVDRPATTTSSAPLGIPLLIAATILLAATVVSARAAGLRRPGALDRWLATIAAVFLVGVVISVAMMGYGREMGDDIKVTQTFGAGLWALFAAVAAAAGAAVMSHRVQEVPMSGDSALAEMPTPKDGISITVLPPEPKQETPDYSAFAPPPTPGAKERD
ncbi:hypothetical protein [Amycolatopsis sp. NPDC102389]|uniref:hypothetical protein n=1 Tax=Amycolatopsis sp. NPDC102389 TaxID=3363941 RepID=UPI003828B599